MKKVVAFIVIAALGLLLGIFFSQKKPSLISRETTAPTPILQPTIPITGISVSQPTYVVDQKHVFPSSIEQYRVSSLVQEETVSVFLTRFFSFSTAPKNVVGSKGTYFIWNEQGKTLIIGGSPLEVSYSFSAQPAGKLSSSTSQYEIAAFAFLSEFMPLFGGATPELVSTTLLASSEEDTVPVENPTDASVFLANYSLSLNARPLLTRSAHAESVSVGLDANKNIVSFRAYVFPTFAKTSASTPLTTYEEAKTALFTGKGALVEFSYEGEKTKENVIFQPSSPPTRSTIYSIKLGYLFSPTEELLMPMFLFLGKGADSSGNILSTTTVVSAIK